MVSSILRRSGVAIARTSKLLKWQPEAIVQIGIGSKWQELDVLFHDDCWGPLPLIGFEPHPILFEAAKRNEYPGLVVQSAVTDCEGEATLWFKKLHKDGATLKKPFLEQDEHEPIVVSTDTLDNLMRTFAPEFLGKRLLLMNDCEGTELEAMQGGEQTLRSCDAVNVEVTSKPKGPGWNHPVEIHRFLRVRGFRRQVAHTHRGMYGQCDAVYVRSELWQEELCHCITELEKEWDGRNR